MVATARYTEFDPDVKVAQERLKTDPAFRAASDASLAAQMAEFRRTHPGGGMGFFDFLGDVAGTVVDVAKTAAKTVYQGPQTLVGLPSLQTITGIDPVEKLFSGNFGGLLGDVAKIGTIVATGGAAAPAVLGGPLLGGVLAKVAQGDYAGAGLGLLGSIMNKGVPAGGPPRPAPPPPGSMVRPAAGGGSPLYFTPSGRPVPALPTRIPIRGPSMNLGTALNIGGPYGLSYSSGSGYGSVRAGGSTGISVAQARSALLANASDRAGFRITWPKLLYMLLHFGIAIVKQLTGLDESQILFLQVNRPHRGKLGPHFRTVEKRVRQAQGYRARVARLAHALGVSRGPTGAHAHLPSRHRRRRRSK
jgi:hypothetical protein